MAELVAFPKSDEAQATAIKMLEDALEMARRGEVRDIAIVLSVRDEDGPQYMTDYYGQGAFASLVAGVASLAFALQYDKRKYDEGRD